jgi:predicted nucleotide-binding protein (sugar kinase/HSP70/actin superfamily)
MIKVGIPRALLYYQYFPMWRTFFNELGGEVVVSPPTTQATLNAGSARVIADTCLPVKVYCGHVIALKEQCDYVFIPVVRSVRSRVFNCSKFLGLPDMTHAVVPDSPPILEIEFDINRNKRHLYQEIYKLGRRFTRNPARVKRAAEAAWQAHLDYRNIMSSNDITPTQALGILTRNEGGDMARNPAEKGNIAVVGHPYLLYDEHVNHRIIHRLERAGYHVLTPEMLTPAQADPVISRLVGRPYWTYEEDVVGAGGYYLDSEITGVIGLSTFGCGPDSLMMNIVHRYAISNSAVPFMSLTLEEHTAEAGIVTRLEAFLDMIQRSRRNKVETCA